MQDHCRPMRWRHPRNSARLYSSQSIMKSKLVPQGRTMEKCANCSRALSLGSLVLFVAIASLAVADDAFAASSNFIICQANLLQHSTI